MWKAFDSNGARLGSRGASNIALAIVALLLGACGSAPQRNESEQAVASATAPATPVANSKGVSKGVPEAADAAAVPEAPVPPEAQQQFDSAVASMNAGNSAAAEQAFRALSDAYPTYAGPLLNLAIMQSKAGSLADAEKTLQDAVARNQSAAAYNQLGIVYRKMGRFEDADQAYQKALRIDGSYALAYLNLGVLCDLYLQQPQRALEAYERYLELAPAPDSKVSGWITELKRRLGTQERSASNES